MRFIHSAATTIVFKAIAMISGLAASIVIARVLGPEGRGIYALVMTIVVMSASFGVFGLTASNTYFIAREKSKSRSIGIQSLYVGIIGAALCATSVLILQELNPQVLKGLNTTLLWLSIALVPLFLWGNLFSFAFLGRSMIVSFNVFETGQRISFFVLALVFLWLLGSTIEVYLTWVLLTLALFVLIYIAYYFAGAPKGAALDKSLFSPALGYGMKSYVATMLTLIVMRSGVMFVNYFNGNEKAGLFAVAQQISELVIIVPTIVGTVLFGRISKGDSYHLTPMVVRTLAFLFLPITVILFFGSDWVVDFVFGSAFGGSVLLLKIMLPAAYLLGLEVVLAQDIAGRGYPWPAVLMWVPIVILNVVGYLILIPVLGLSGAAISLSVSFVVIFLLIVGYYKRLAHVGISELLIVRREDLKLLHSNLQTVFSQIITPKNKSSKNAVTTFTNQNKTKAQSISS